MTSQRAPRIKRFSYADEFTGQYRDETAFMTALLGAVTIHAREACAWGGMLILRIDWTEQAGQRFAALECGPGQSWPTLDDVRDAWRAQREAEKKARADQAAEDEAA